MNVLESNDVNIAIIYLFIVQQLNLISLEINRIFTKIKIVASITKTVATKYKNNTFLGYQGDNLNNVNKAYLILTNFTQFNHPIKFRFENN